MEDWITRRIADWRWLRPAADGLWVLSIVIGVMVTDIYRKFKHLFENNLPFVSALVFN